MKRIFLASAVSAAVLFFTPAAADAIPAFSLQTGLQCDACHTAPREVNDFGKTYAKNGYRLGNLGAGGAPVIALRGQFANTSAVDPTGLPKTIVDEVEIFLADRITPQLSASAEFYILDGGEPGSTREAWLQYTSHGNVGGAPLRLTGGSITLPLPVDPETSRQTNEHYAIYDQTVGANPFAFIDPRNALSLGVGNQVRGMSGTVIAMQSHDPLSQLPDVGTDRMYQLQDAMHGVTVSAYHVDGQRALGPIEDQFTRTGFGLNAYRGRLAFESVLQTGYDTSPNGDGLGISSSGGFAQLRYSLSGGNFALLRYDGVNQSVDGAFARSLTIGAIHPIGKILRLELEDVIAHGGPTTHTFNSSLGFGFSNAKLGSSAY